MIVAVGKLSLLQLRACFVLDCRLPTPVNTSWYDTNLKLLSPAVVCGMHPMTHHQVSWAIGRLQDIVNKKTGLQ